MPVEKPLPLVTAYICMSVSPLPLHPSLPGDGRPLRQIFVSGPYCPLAPFQLILVTDPWGLFYQPKEGLLHSRTVGRDQRKGSHSNLCLLTDRIPPHL